MNFDLPLRIHWQLPDPVSSELVEAVRACQPLVVTLEIDRVEQLALLGLPWQGITAVVIHRGWRNQEQDLPTGWAGRWEFPVSEPGEALKVAGRSFFGLAPGEAAFRWFPRRGRLGDLVPILRKAADSGCGLTLPNRPAGVINSEGAAAFPDPGELTGQILSELAGISTTMAANRLRIHDFILTEALGLEGVEPQGCEAGNSIAFVDQQGEVYPCETLMVPMGNINSAGFNDIWASPLKARIRKDVGSIPGICSPCPDLPRCRGGCRGAVYHLWGHYGAPDPVCGAGGE